MSPIPTAAPAKVLPEARNVKLINISGRVNSGGVIHGLKGSPIKGVKFEKVTVSAHRETDHQSRLRRGFVWFEAGREGRADDYYHRRTLSLMERSKFTGRLWHWPLGWPRHKELTKPVVAGFMPAFYASMKGAATMQAGFCSWLWVQQIRAAPANSTGLFVIHIERGVYNEFVGVPRIKPFLSFVGGEAA
jgi:hypothetical protein